MEWFDAPICLDLNEESLTAQQEQALEKACNRAKALSVAMVARANSGHPAGSLSSLKLYLTAYLASDLRPDNCDQPDRDYVVISHGHTSPAAYSTLAYLGFFSAEAAFQGFRKATSMFAGHVEREMPGIDWTSGNLGQGLSAGVGFALAQKARGHDGYVYVLMGDGEQPKGQVAEARRLAMAQNLNHVIALVDVNHIQISGRTDQVLPCHVAALWEADGWQVFEVNGSSFQEIYQALRAARSCSKPAVILAQTVMGEGVSFMEDRPDYHGKAATGDLLTQALNELGEGDPFELLAREKPEPCRRDDRQMKVSLPFGQPRTYGVDETTDCRGAFGKALNDVAQEAQKNQQPFLVFDCDLAGSVKTDGVMKNHPQMFVQAGIQEHNTAVVAGAASVAGVKSLFAGFGMFGLVECYNQQRLNDINETNLTLALTHVGLDVGEDGKTHQCIDYVGLLSGCMTWKLICPADGNQADRATRWALSNQGNCCLAMGRSKLPILKDDAGSALFDRDFVYGQVVTARKGKDGAILALGPMAHQAVMAADQLKSQGMNVAVYVVSSPLEICDQTLKKAFATGKVLTVEDHSVRSGMGSLWLARASELGLSAKVQRLGVHRWGVSGPSKDVYQMMGLDSAGIQKAMELLK